MSALAGWAAALPAMLLLSLLAWGVATARRNAGLVDIFWSLFFLAGAAVYAREGVDGPAMMALVLVALWALRLAGYLAWRNWNAEEDRRYQDIRRRNQPNFALKSLVFVFALQAALAWIISAPLYVALAGGAAFGAPALAGAALVLVGIGFETLGDAQLARFKADPANRGRVMDRGLWRYTRHPNYFGEFCVWWGFWALALPAGAWTVFAPLLMTFLLLRVSGVKLLEKDIAERRPGYREYAQRTNAFFPGPPRSA